MDCELLIAGQGLAGTLLAWEAHWAGLRVAIIDPDETETASKVAAGIINPITGHRLTRSWRFDEFYPIAIEFYKRVERELDRSFYHSRSILRCLDNGRAARLWRRRAERADYRHLWSDDAHLVRSLDCGWFQPSDARFATQRCGNLEVEAFLESSRRFFSAQHRVLSEALDPAAIEMPEAESGVRYRGLSARHAVLCLGEKGRDVRFFGHLSLRRAKGEVLELELADCREDRIINRGGKWLLPTGGGRFLAGATYNWDPQDGLPSAEGRAEISAGLQAILKQAPVIRRHRAGIRPVVKGSRPVLGRHPAHPAVCIFNGLGSKGVLNGPYFANKLIRHILADETLDPETDIRSHL